jgi:hypothetical protein
MPEGDLIKLALEWFRCQPPTQRTREKLAGIVAHACQTYAVPAQRVEALTEQAWQSCPVWQRAEDAHP